MMFNRVIKIAAYVIIAYISMYIAIWLHEISHALVYNYYGCKPNIFDVQVPFYFGNSNPYPVNMDCARGLSKFQNFAIGISGILVNLIFGILVYFTISRLKNTKTSQWLIFFATVFALAHFAEASSYLTISTLYPTSDIIAINQYDSLIRIPLFIVGGFVLFLMYKIILNSPKRWRIGLILFVTLSIISMGGLRLLFTLLNTK